MVKRNIVRTLAVAAALVLMLSLAGCNLIISVVGSRDFYEIDETGVIDGPIKVNVTLKGLWPIWPDYMVAEIAGTVNPVGPADALDPSDIIQADLMEDAIYAELSSDDYDFEQVTPEAITGDDKFKVTVEMIIPRWEDLLGTSGASTQITFNEIPLDKLLGENYDALVSGLVDACDLIPQGDLVQVEMSATLSNEAKDKLVGDLLIGFILNGPPIDLP